MLGRQLSDAGATAPVSAYLTVGELPAMLIETAGGWRADDLINGYDHAVYEP